MNRKALNNNDLERFLLDATEADRAGVFTATPVDAASLLAQGVESTGTRRVAGLYRWAKIVTPLAACVGLWIGVEQSDLFGPESVISNVPAMNGALAGGEIDCIELSQFNRCFTGPSGAPSVDCACADLDQDGDVDFADFGKFQTIVTARNG